MVKRALPLRALPAVAPTVVLALLSTLSVAALAGCGDDEGGSGGAGGEGTTSSTSVTNSSSSGVTSSTTASTSGGEGGEAGEGGAAGTGGGGGGEACSGADTAGCDVVVEPSDDDTTAIQEALIDGVDSGDTVCLCPGTYSLDREISLTVPDVTVRGVGDSREDVVLDFAAQTQDDDGVAVDSDGFTIEHLTVKNTPGNGIVVRGAERVTFRDLLVTWDAGPSTDNGAYAVYPVSCSQVLIEDCEVIAAADAGIYVGQSDTIIVRNNVVHDCVAGIEIENSDDADVYGNEAYDNTAGILVFVLPNLEKKDGFRTTVHDNDIHDNNGDNFGAPGTIVSNVPTGIGMLILAADVTEVHDNDFTGNESSSIVLISYETIAAALGEASEDPLTDPYLSEVYIHDNTFVDNGTSPQTLLLGLGVNPVEDVVWDGVVEPKTAASLCLSDAPPSFRNFNGFANITNEAAHSTDTGPYECDGTIVDAQDF